MYKVSRFQEGVLGQLGPETDSEAVRAKRECDKINENAGSAGSAQSSEGERGRRLYGCAKRREGAHARWGEVRWRQTQQGNVPPTSLHKNLQISD
jgi:hypothetical protein